MTTPSRIRVPLTIDQLRWVIGALVILMAVCMVIAFFTASWLEVLGEEKVSAWELWIGRHDGDEFTLSMDEDAKGGFGDVRGIDRLVILVPLGALLLGALGVNYAFRRFWYVSPRTTAIAILITAVILFLLPFFWQIFSTGDWRATLKDFGLSGKILNTMLDVYKETFAYSTGQQIAYGLIALLAGIGAVALETPQTRARLDLTPSNPVES